MSVLLSGHSDMERESERGQPFLKTDFLDIFNFINAFIPSGNSKMNKHIVRGGDAAP